MTNNKGGLKGNIALILLWKQFLIVFLVGKGGFHSHFGKTPLQNSGQYEIPNFHSTIVHKNNDGLFS